jgi:hydrogenase expression/formation protein HypE
MKAPPFRWDHDRIDLSFGAGGSKTTQLVEELFIKAFDNPWIAQRHDNAQMPFCGRLVVATDAHVVSPLFFPGGDIGKLAVCGTVNDVCMSGALPLFLTASFILEEGFPLSDLKKIVYSMAETAKACKVAIVAGDTKVVEKGKGDGLFISTTGIGCVQDEALQLFPKRVQPGDHIILNGTLGDHGIAILSQRENLSFHTTLQSDVTALNDLIHKLIEAVPQIHCLRDPTRGGLAALLNEITQQAQVGILLKEETIPLRPEVESACEFLGLDPLNIANEGKIVVFCSPEHSSKALEVLKTHPLGRNSALIGEVLEPPSFVRMKTKIGGIRMVHWVSGEELPRIC